MGFQKQVNLQQAPAVEGDFASANPRAVVLSPEAGFVAGNDGVTIGRFAWIGVDGVTVENVGIAPAAPNGFVHREQQGLITAYLAEQSMLVPQGLPVVLHNQGDFWVKNAGSGTTAIGESVYADYGTGQAANAIQTGASVTAIMGSTNTASLGATFTASADTDPTRLVVTSVTGLISVGDFVSGTGITAGTTIVSQVSGTTGGAGTYQLSASNTASSATVTAYGKVIKVTSTTGLISIGETVSGGAGFPVGATIAAQLSGTTGGAGNYQLSAAGSAYVASASGVTTFGNVLNVTVIGSGTLEVGDPVSGTGLPTGAAIASQVSGTVGGIGVYTLTLPATAYAASTTVTAVGGVVTSWKFASVAATGELAKITSWS